MTAPPIFQRTYGAASRIITDLCDPYLQALENLQVTQGGTAFSQALSGVVERLIQRAASGQPLPGVEIRGVDNPLREAFHELFLGLGVPSDTAGRYAHSLAASAQRAGIEEVHWRYALSRWQPVIYSNARRLHTRIEDIRRDAARPYDPDDGVEQTVELLQRFPDLAPTVYAEAGLSGIQGFPPQIVGAVPATDSDEAVFVSAVGEELDGQWWSNMISGVAIAVVSLAVIAATGGLAAAGIVPAGVATAVGAGVGTVSGGLMVITRLDAVGEAEAAVTLGAMTDETAQEARDALNGALGMLAIDAITGGIAGRATQTARFVPAMLRGALISGAGGGVGALIDPAVWRADNTAALVVQAVVIDTMTGLLGSAGGAAVAALIRRGAPVRFAMTRAGRAESPPRIRVETDGAQPADGRLLSVDSAEGTAVIEVGGQRATVRVERTVAVDESSFPPGYSPRDPPRGSAAPGGAEPPMRPEIAHRYRHVPIGGYLVRGTQRIWIQGTQHQVRMIDIRIRQLQRFPAGRRLIAALDEALGSTAQRNVDVEVGQTARDLGWDSPADDIFIVSERQRLAQENRRNQRVVIRYVDGEGRIECRPLRGETAHRDDGSASSAEGSGSVVQFDPDRWSHVGDDGSTHRPPTPAIVLGHELIHAHRHATGNATRNRALEEQETIGLATAPGRGDTRQITENDLREGWAALQRQVAELRTSY